MYKKNKKDPSNAKARPKQDQKFGSFSLKVLRICEAASALLSLLETYNTTIINTLQRLQR